MLSVNFCVEQLLRPTQSGRRGRLCGRKKRKTTKECEPDGPSLGTKRPPFPFFRLLRFFRPISVASRSRRNAAGEPLRLYSSASNHRQDSGANPSQAVSPMFHSPTAPTTGTSTVFPCGHPTLIQVREPALAMRVIRTAPICGVLPDSLRSESDSGRMPNQRAVTGTGTPLGKRMPWPSISAAGHRHTGPSPSRSASQTVDG